MLDESAGCFLPREELVHSKELIHYELDCELPFKRYLPTPQDCLLAPAMRCADSEPYFGIMFAPMIACEVNTLSVLMMAYDNYAAGIYG